MFADWLDEHGTTDQDAARAEYIRLSCKVKSGETHKKRLAVSEGKWLDANWKRLLPTLVGAAVPMRYGTPFIELGGIKTARNGRDLRVAFTWRWDSTRPEQPSRYSAFTMHFWFWRGFVVKFDVYSPRQLYLVGGLVAQDEPFAVPHLQNPPVSWRYQYDAIMGSAAREHAIGPAWQHIGDWSSISEEPGLSPVKWFEFLPNESQESNWRRATTAVEAATLKWVALNKGVSLYNRKSNLQPNYEPVTLPVDDAPGSWPQQAAINNLNWGAT